MVAICCCQCDPRLATYTTAVISFLHFSVEVMLLTALDDQHRLVAEDDGIKFYTVYGTHIYLVFSAILLFFGAYYLWALLCIPWLIGCTFNLLIYLAILMLVFIRIFGDGDMVELEKALFLMFTMGAMVYGMWIVIVFVWEINSNRYGKLIDLESASKRVKSVSKSFLTMHDYETTDEESTMEDGRKESKTKQSKSKKTLKNESSKLIPE